MKKETILKLYDEHETKIKQEIADAAQYIKTLESQIQNHTNEIASWKEMKAQKEANLSQYEVEIKTLKEEIEKEKEASKVAPS